MVPDSDNKPTFKPVTVGQQNQDKIQILDGLREGQRVFTQLPEEFKQKEKED
jgi:HlyD family secretion protein